MNYDNLEFGFLTKEQVSGNNVLEILADSNGKMAVTDFAILLGAAVSDNRVNIISKDLKERTGYYFLDNGLLMQSLIYTVSFDGSIDRQSPSLRNIASRPVLYLDLDSTAKNLNIENDNISKIEFGEYPQYSVSEEQNKVLEELHSNCILNLTGKTYTTDSRSRNDTEPFRANKLEEYEYKGKKYVRVISFNYIHGNKDKVLSNGMPLGKMETKPIWIEVSPITWLVSENKILISEKGLFAGVRYNNMEVNVDFKNSEIKKYLNENFTKDIIPSIVDTNVIQKMKSVPGVKKNPYGFDFSDVTEENIIKGCIESGISVFLHGQSSDGKSARVKQLDPNLEIIYLRNATPDSLNGKSVYNPEKQEMIDIPPTWFKKVKAKCENEPDKIHIIFFDEITNALPSIQGMAYNIILDREVNGIWKLPDNCRIVAAGNEMKDSLAANQLAEPLYNRFAHVYITTTVEEWLKWAVSADKKKEKLDYKKPDAEKTIHPAVYAYITFKKDAVLRSKYTGEKPNADPRKWEMASRVLYRAKQPEMLRSLVGEAITKDFVKFCNHKVITLEDVINGTYKREDLNMSVDEKWATTVGLTSVDDVNLETVRNFVRMIEPEMISIFDSLWINGEESRMEKIMELRLKESANYSSKDNNARVLRR